MLHQAAVSMRCQWRLVEADCCVRSILGEHSGKTAQRDADKSDRLRVQLLRASARYCLHSVVLPSALSSLTFYAAAIMVALCTSYVIGHTIIFSSCGFFFLSSIFFSSPNLSRRRLGVYHTSTQRCTGRSPRSVLYAVYYFASINVTLRYCSCLLWDFVSEAVTN